MTFPSGQGGQAGPQFGQGPQFGAQPQPTPGQGFGQPQSGSQFPPGGQQPFGGQQPQAYGQPGKPLDLPKILQLVTAGLGVVILFLGFLPFLAGGIGPDANVFLGGAGWVPALYLTAGLLAVTPLLPGGLKKLGPAPAMISIAVTLPLLFFVIAASAGIKIGGIIILILGVLQAAAAVVVYLYEAEILKPPAAQPAYPQAWNPQSGGFPQSGSQFGQPQSGQPGQFGQPASDQPAQSDQPFGQPPQAQQENPPSGGFGAQPPQV